MKPETYAKRYGGNAAMWNAVLVSMKSPMAILERNNKHYCPICGHAVRQISRCSYCGQILRQAQ